MLRYLAHGWRNLVTSPDQAPIRMNWEFFAVLNGACAPRFMGKGKPRRLRKSTLWLMPPWSQYVWCGENRPCLRAVFHITNLPQIMTNHLPAASFYETPINEEQGRHILKLTKDIEPMYYHPDETYELHVSRLISELCLIVLHPFSFKKENPLYHLALERVQKAEVYYRTHLHCAPSVEETAAATGISASQLRRHFQLVRDTSPQLAFRSLRLRYACYLLSSDLTLDRVSEQAGFMSKADFHRAFKAHFGVTPHFWRTHPNKAMSGPGTAT